MSIAKGLCAIIISVKAQHRRQSIIVILVCSTFLVINVISLCSVQIVTILNHQFISGFIHIFAKSSDAKVHGLSGLTGTLLTQKPLSRIRLVTLWNLLLTQILILSYRHDVFSLCL